MKASDIMTEKVQTLQSDATVSEALSMIREKKVHSIPILTKKKYSGMVIYRDLFRRRTIQTRAKVSGYLTNTPHLSPDDDVLAVVEKLRSSGLPALPVIEDEKLAGIISKADLIRSFSDIYNATSATAMDIMSHSPVAVREDDSADMAHEKIRGTGQYEIPVITHEGKLAGILRMDDLMEKVLSEKDKISYGQYTSSSGPIKIKVDSIMDSKFFVKSDSPITECARIMAENSLHMIPVLDGKGDLVGIVNQSDLIGIIDTRMSMEGLLVNISGLDHGDDDLYDLTYYNAEKFAQKFSKITGHENGTLNIHVIRYKEEGTTKYSVRTKLLSGGISMTIDSFDWNYGKCLYEIFEAYDHRLRKMKEKADQ